jgi:hypothetical protein
VEDVSDEKGNGELPYGNKLTIDGDKGDGIFCGVVKTTKFGGTANGTDGDCLFIGSCNCSANPPIVKSFSRTDSFFEKASLEV